MKNWLLTLVLIVGTISIAGCTQQQPVSEKESYQHMKQETQEAVKATGDFITAENQAALDKIEADIEKMKLKIQEMKELSKGTAEKLQASTKESINQLETRLQTIGDRFRILKEQAKTFKSDLQPELDDLKASTQELWKAVEAKLQSLKNNKQS